MPRAAGVRPMDTPRFDPALYTGTAMLDAVSNIPPLDSNGEVRNRRGILLSNLDSPQTKTLTPTLWSLSLIHTSDPTRPYQTS